MQRTSHLRPRLTAFAAALSLSLAAVAAGASQLGDAAAAMQAGQWRQLATSNINATLIASGASGIVFGFTETIKWDPTSRQLFFLGGDHADVPHFIRYQESTNSWARLPRPSWMGSATMHGYDHTAIDAQRRFLYHRPYPGGSSVHRYNIDTQSWSSLPAPPNSVMGYDNCCVGIDFFPELDAVVYASVESGNDGALVKLDVTTNQWSRVTQPVLTMGTLHHFAEYNPVHKVVLFGGGDGSRNVYKVNASGQVTTLRQAPVTLGVQSSIVTVDPISGDYLVFTEAGQFYVYKVATDTWTAQSGASALPIWTTSYSNAVHGVVAAPIATHGVTLFVTCNGSNDCRVNLYKHGSGNPVPTPASPTNVQAN